MNEEYSCDKSGWLDPKPTHSTSELSFEIPT